MNVVMIVPTGIGCEVGGHAGDANPAAKLLGAACDTLILHPNVVNASDINEMPDNALYVEGCDLGEDSTGLRQTVYLEAAGAICAMRAGISLASVSRPLGRTIVLR